MNAPFAWPGGKKCLIKTLLPRIPEHTLYVEVFAGSAKLLFAKPPSKREVLNDLNGDVANFFRVVKHRSAELAEVLEQEIAHPERFRELAKEVNSDELARAMRFAYTTWYSYGAKGQHFAALSVKEALRGGTRRSMAMVRGLLTSTAERLRQVSIEQRDFAQLITRYDTSATFFYLDPPYLHFGHNARYQTLPAARYEELFRLLARAKGNFLMSLDDCAEARELAQVHGMRVEQVRTRYGLGHTSAARMAVTEVLITGEGGRPPEPPNGDGSSLDLARCG